MEQQAAQQAGQQVVNTVNSVNPQITSAAQTAGQGVSGAAGSAAGGAINGMFEANAALDPWAQMGQGAVNALTANMGQYAQGQPTLQQLQLSPAFGFALQQGEQALSRSAAAQGGASGGGAAKAMTRYAEDYSGNQYQNAFQNYETGLTNSYNMLTGMANAGQQASTVQGANIMNSNQYAGNALMSGAQYAGNAGMNAANLTAANSIGGAEQAGNYLTQGASAAAAGQIGGANALTAGITGAGNSIMNGMAMGGYGGYGGYGSNPYAMNYGSYGSGYGGFAPYNYGGPQPMGGPAIGGINTNGPSLFPQSQQGPSL